MRVLVRSGLALLTSLGAAASGPRPQPTARVVWRPGHQLLIDARHVLDRDLTGEDPAQELVLPPDTLWVSSRPEGLYALVAVPLMAGTPAHLEVRLRAAGSRAWATYAVLPKGLDGVRAALPTADGRLFLAPNGAILQIPGAAPDDPRAWAPFLLMGRDG
ncbi:MAG TPA: hypothetical protein VFT46_07755, partial [Holophagaceae bacterium]|nr:hypothetical protein [Holophagaceae bacterium]